MNTLYQRMAIVRKKRVEESKNILLEKLEIAKQILINEFHPKKIILHGSLARGKDVHPFSDIDLIVEGLGDNYLRAGGRLINTLGECIDLKSLEMLEKDFKDHVLKTGKIIYISDVSYMLDILKSYFEKRQDVAFAFLFGSAIRGKIRKEGDVDIGIYFWPGNDVEWEEFGKAYPGEAKIGLDLERLLKKEVDLIVLNRARAILADEIIRKGKPIIIKDKGLFMDFLCIVSDEAEYIRDWLSDYYEEIKLVSGR